MPIYQNRPQYDERPSLETMLQMGVWIAVNDAPPPTAGDFLITIVVVVNGYNVPRTVPAWGSISGPRDAYGDPWESHGKITHWRPMPEAAKVNEK